MPRKFTKKAGDYELICTSVETRPGCWNTLLVEICKGGKKLGEYNRNYHAMYDTFCPFTYKDKDYALYSRDYTSTRVMSLPDCKDLGGEDPAGGGFCPVEYYVPIDEDGDLESGIDGSFGFVAGCVWGDDSSWKIQYLDLSGIEEGTLKREERFGYIELPRGVSLKDAIDLEDYDIRYEDDFDSIEIAQPFRYKMKTGEMNDWWLKKSLKSLLKKAEEGKLDDARNPFYRPHNSWVFDAIKEHYSEATIDSLKDK